MEGRFDVDKRMQRAMLLLERAGHPGTPEEEARTCAMMLVRIIREEGFSLVEKGQPLPKREPAPSPSPSPSRQPPVSTKKKRKASADVYVLSSMYVGTCKSCRETYAEGDAIAWVPSKGATHYECRQYWENRA